MRRLPTVVLLLLAAVTAGCGEARDSTTGWAPAEVESSPGAQRSEPDLTPPVRPPQADARGNGDGVEMSLGPYCWLDERNGQPDCGDASAPSCDPGSGFLLDLAGSRTLFVDLHVAAAEVTVDGAPVEPASKVEIPVGGQHGLLQVRVRDAGGRGEAVWSVCLP